MSDSYLRIIPTEPTYTPAPDAQQAARELLIPLVPQAEAVRSKTFENIQFIDAGENFESISCPACDKEVPIEWWQRAMELASKTNFQVLVVDLPCCGATRSLNELNYKFNQGFARYVLEVLNPAIAYLRDSALHELEQVLGSPLRLVWARY